MKRRVVITGMGATTPIGASVAESLESLKAGRGGVRFMPEFDRMKDMQGRLGAPVEGVDLLKHYDRKVRRTMGRVALLALHATEQAVDQAKLDEALFDSGRAGVAYGSTSGSSSELERFSGPLMLEGSMRGLQSNAFLRFMAHTCAANLAKHYRLKGRVASTCTACTSGSQAIGEGYELIRAGTQDVMICGGAEELHYTTAVTFDLLMATSVHFNDSPDESPRPFDRRRDGLVVGEAAGTLVLEELEHARARGAEILGEVLGYASNCDGGHMTSPDPEGMRAVIELALADAHIAPNEVGYVNAHATGTLVGDIAESQATFQVFGGKVPVSSLKGFVGHTLGACGAIEAAWCLGALRDGFLPAGKNLDEVDPECAPLDYVRECRDTTERVFVSNNFAFGGINTSMVIRVGEPLDAGAEGSQQG